MAPSKKKLIIAGCPRSGTSLFAHCLTACGLRTPVDRRSSEQYPRGYYEHFPLLLFHKALERYPRGAMHRITSEPYLTADILKDPFTSRMFAEAFLPFSDPKVDFIKYPQLALSADFLLGKYPDLHLILLWRNPAAVFSSLVQKEFPRTMRPVSYFLAVALQAVYAGHLLDAVRKHPGRTTILKVDRLISRGIDLAPLLEWLGYQVKPPVRLADHMEPGVWTQHPSPGWALAYRTALLVSRISGPLIPNNAREFFDLTKRIADLERISHESDISGN